MCDLAYPPTDRVSGCWGKEHRADYLPSQKLLRFCTQPCSSVNPEGLAWGSLKTYPVGVMHTLLGFKPGTVPGELHSHL